MVKGPTQKEKIWARLEELGATAKRSLGQNFLIESQIIEKIVEKAHSFNASSLVEIGPGLGSLTEYLNKDQLLLIELDTKFAQYWSAQGYKVIEADALKLDWKQLGLKDYVLVSNLPYQISARLVVEMSVSGGPSAMVLMFQKEVTDRILSAPSSKDYGYLTVMAQSFWEIKRLCLVSASCFHPRPNVESAVLTFVDKAKDRTHAALFSEFVKLAFMERRKKLINKLKRYKHAVNWSQLLEALGHNENVRAEELSVQDFQSLFESSLK
ncbi:MAG: 16S rRNA (adenine(1518)-N(6)/adenine(1519)-N(6))-dimethyltransferase RsmA [Bdellovibrionaceae bacterium]|nr:16S rRNA (adenine(1518)-N(6)/adenine(1519)-N(6))-dimethyltransferase RsmA [Pseudobdellovibrionaceae bacterium]